MVEDIERERERAERAKEQQTNNNNALRRNSNHLTINAMNFHVSPDQTDQNLTLRST